MFSVLVVLAAAGSAAASFAGKATFYGGNTKGGMCSFSTYTLPQGLYGTALSDSNWAGSEACGGCVQVTGPSGKKITAMVTDQCPGCGANHLDLYSDAFSKLADPSKGIIDVTWDYVECPISKPLQVHMKSGVSANWFSAQVVNANKQSPNSEHAYFVVSLANLIPRLPRLSKEAALDTLHKAEMGGSKGYSKSPGGGRIAELEYSTDGGKTWKGGLARQPYNFFQLSSGTGTNTVAVRAESVDGDRVVVKDVKVTSDNLVTGQANF